MGEGRALLTRLAGMASRVRREGKAGASSALPVSSLFFGHLPEFAANKLEFVERCERLAPIVRLRFYHQQIRDELVTLFLASYEPSSAAVAWTLYFASTQRAVLQKIREELSATLGELELVALDVRSLPYLNNVVREALRLYPSVPVFGREAIAPVRIGEFDIERGAQLLVCPWAVQRSERWFPRPRAFEPERWETLQERDLPRYAYFPFAGGPRVCTGQNMALREALLISAMILEKVTFRSLSSSLPPVELGLTMVPQRGSMQMQIESISQPERAPASAQPESAVVRKPRTARPLTSSA